jgi:Co/Zn/Cd efflux system component
MESERWQESRRSSRRRLFTALGISASFFVIELIGGSRTASPYWPMQGTC